MKKAVLIATTLLLSSLHILASGNSNYVAQWNKGTNFYLQKNYDSAAYYFEEIAAQKPQNAEVYYNLGDTYYRLNKIPNAVLNYERALRFNPSYKNAKENLALAQARIPNNIPYSGDIFFIAWWKSVTQPDRATLWAVCALVPFCLIIIAMALRRFSPAAGRILPAQLLGALWTACICFLILGFFTAKNKEQNDGAVVMVNDVPLMNNDLKGKPIALLPEGTTVKIMEQKNSWMEVRLPDGRVGWMQQNTAEKI